MGSSASKNFQAIDIVKNSRIVTVLATLALCAAIVSCLVSLYNYYLFSLQKQPHVNIASVPGHTDCTGNLRLSGDLIVESWQEANSETEASLVTRGGIGSIGKIKAGRGMYANNFDSLHDNSVLNIGRENHVGVVMGKRDFPIEFQANRFVVDCPQTDLQHLNPLLTQSYNLGNNSHQWNDLHLARNVVNNNGFATRAGSGGVYVMLENGPKLHGLSNSVDSILTSQKPDSEERSRSFYLHSLKNGDILELNISGILSASNPVSHDPTSASNILKANKKLSLTFTLNGLHSYIPWLFHLHQTNYSSLKFKIKFRIFKRDDSFYIMSSIKVSEQEKQETFIILDEKCIPEIYPDKPTLVFWDVCVDRSRPGFGPDGFIQATFCEMHKVF